MTCFYTAHACRWEEIWGVIALLRIPYLAVLICIRRCEKHCTSFGCFIFQDKEDSAGSDPASPESEIEIIHERVPPNLHSILKQRSRTTSESSDEVFSSSFSRENSITTSESPISEGDEEHASGRKKSVSFSEQVDHTSYKSNSTVSALHNTLKNRRKKARKREEKRSKGKGSRRRRTSSGGSYSSDDLSSSGKPEEFQLGDADLDPHTKVTKKGTGDVRRGSPVDDEVRFAHSPPETKSQSKSKQLVAQEEAAATDTNVLENKKDLREDCKRVQKRNAPRKPSDVTQIGNEPPVKPDGNSITNGHDASANQTDIIDEKDVFRDPKLNHGGDNAPCVNVSSDENSSNTKSRNRKRKNKNKQVWVISGGSEDEDDKSEENKVANEAEDEEQKVAKADTKLKWEESKHQADSNEHKTQCAFQFSNSLMYDLDED